MALTDEATKNFLLVLDEIERNFQFIQFASLLRPRLNDFIAQERIPQMPGARPLISNFLNAKDVDLSIYYRGLTIVLAGGFEELIRGLMRDALAECRLKHATFETLPERIRNNHIFRTGKALTTIFEPPDHLRFDYHLLAKNLAECAPGSRTFSLNADAFSAHVTNLTPKHLGDVLDSLDIKLDWDFFGQERAFREIFGTTGARATGKAVESHLKEFVRIRNQIAHSGVGGVVISEADFSVNLRFFKAFASRLHSCVADGLG